MVISHSSHREERCGLEERKTKPVIISEEKGRQNRCKAAALYGSPEIFVHLYLVSDPQVESHFHAWTLLHFQYKGDVVALKRYGFL